MDLTHCDIVMLVKLILETSLTVINWRLNTDNI